MDKPRGHRPSSWNRPVCVFWVISRATWVPPHGWPPGKQPALVSDLMLFRMSLVVRFRTPHTICVVLPEACFIFLQQAV